jgi:cytoskeletal protein CcmA (bactofilin family)
MSDARSKEKEQPCASIDTLIGANAEVKGTLVFSGGLRIDGKVKGNIMASAQDNSTVVLSERAEVNGNVQVPHITLQGRIKGNVHSSERIELQRRAQITGDVHYKEMQIAVGATVEGNLVHVSDKRIDEAGVVAKLKPAAMPRSHDPKAEGGG